MLRRLWSKISDHDDRAHTRADLRESDNDPDPDLMPTNLSKHYLRGWTF